MRIYAMARRTLMMVALWTATMVGLAIPVAAASPAAASPTPNVRTCTPYQYYTPTWTGGRFQVAQSSSRGFSPYINAQNHNSTTTNITITMQSGYTTSYTLSASASVALSDIMSTVSAATGMSLSNSVDNGLSISVPVSTPPGWWANGDAGASGAASAGTVYQVTYSCADNYVASVSNFQAPHAPSLDAYAAASPN